MTDALPAPLYWLCSRGDIVAESLLATMPVRRCPCRGCTSTTFTPATPLQESLAKAGAVAVRDNRKLDYRGEH